MGSGKCNFSYCSRACSSNQMQQEKQKFSSTLNVCLSHTKLYFTTPQPRLVGSLLLKLRMKWIFRGEQRSRQQEIRRLQRPLGLISLSELISFLTNSCYKVTEKVFRNIWKHFFKNEPCNTKLTFVSHFIYGFNLFMSQIYCT